MGDIDQSCQGCSYMENNSCMRYVENRNGRTILCSQGRGNIETQGNDPQSQTHTCNTRACPPKCYLPYPKGYYNGNVDNEFAEYYTADGIFNENKLDELRDNAGKRESFREASTTESNRAEMVNDIYDSSDETQVALSAQFKCGPLREGRNYPTLPTLDEMNRLFDSSSYISDTKWDKIKTPLSSEGIFSTSTSTLEVSSFDTLGDIFNNTLKHLLDFNGVDIDDLKEKMDENYSIESERLKNIDDIEFKQEIQLQLRRLGFSDSDNQINQVYNETIGLFKRTLEDAKNGSNGSPTCNGEVVSDDVYNNLTSEIDPLIFNTNLEIQGISIDFGENLVYHYNDDSKCSHAKFNNKMIEFILNYVFQDNKKYLSETIINDWASKKMLDLSITGGQMQQRPMRLIDVFMITEDDSSNFDLETRLNNLMDTGLDPDEEKLTVERIGNYTSIEELGRNPRDVEFIEKKIKKFLGANTQDLVDAFLLSSVSYEDMCNTGFSDRPMKILGNLMNVQTDASNLQEGLYEEKMVIKKLLKYIPSIMRKVLEIAEKVEMERCDRVSKKTQLYKEIYKDLFIDSNVMKFELPDMGIFKFFEDFNRNIYTKIILLIILTFMISKIISLFKVNIST